MSPPLLYSLSSSVASFFVAFSFIVKPICTYATQKKPTQLCCPGSSHPDQFLPLGTLTVRPLFYYFSWVFKSSPWKCIGWTFLFCNGRIYSLRKSFFFISCPISHYAPSPSLSLPIPPPTSYQIGPASKSLY